MKTKRMSMSGYCFFIQDIFDLDIGSKCPFAST
nr:MAG TPA: hypothetical protein [Caudoviricetes sp.]